jgi:UDP-3-O-[3-hydroxymyristoyl] glucosamine N-acyltransferase
MPYTLSELAELTGTVLSGSAEVVIDMVADITDGFGSKLEIADNVILAGRSNVSSSIKAPGMYASVIPAVEAGKWNRILARIKQLDEPAKRNNVLETKTK